MAKLITWLRSIRQLVLEEVLTMALANRGKLLVLQSQASKGVLLSFTKTSIRCSVPSVTAHAILNIKQVGWVIGPLDL